MKYTLILFFILSNTLSLYSSQEGTKGFPEQEITVWISLSGLDSLTVPYAAPKEELSYIRKFSNNQEKDTELLTKNKDNLNSAFPGKVQTQDLCLQPQLIIKLGNMKVFRKSGIAEQIIHLPLDLISLPNLEGFKPKGTPIFKRTLRVMGLQRTFVGIFDTESTVTPLMLINNNENKPLIVEENLKEQQSIFVKKVLIPKKICDIKKSHTYKNYIFSACIFCSIACYIGYVLCKKYK